MVAQNSSNITNGALTVPSIRPTLSRYSTSSDLMAAKAADHYDMPGKIAWLASLDTNAKPAKEFRRTSIM